MKRFRRVTLSLIIGVIAYSCGSNPYSRTNRVHKQRVKELTAELREFPPERAELPDSLNFADSWVGTTNFSLRRPNFVIIHHTAQDSVEQTLRTFTLPRTSVSSHYVISEDGEIYQMLDDHFRAWHAGTGEWGNTNDLNSSSIGIELDNDGFEPFSVAQIGSLLKLLGMLKEKYNIPTANFIGHSDIAPTRKVDPNPYFPWKTLAEEGFGLWYDQHILEENPIEKNLPQVPGELDRQSATDSIPAQRADPKPYLQMDPEMALRIIGYDTENLDAAIKAFKLHFIQQEVNAELTERDLKILHNLYQKYM